MAEWWASVQQWISNTAWPWISDEAVPLEALGSILGGAFAALAVAVSVTVAIVARRDSRVADDDRRTAQAELAKEREASREAAKRAQAERVVGWFRHAPGDQRRADGQPTGRQPKVCVGNYSDAPIFDVELTAVTSRDSTPVVHSRLKWDFLPPGVHETPVAPVLKNESVDVVVEFRDVAGVRWKRPPNTSPQEVSSGSPADGSRFRAIGRIDPSGGWHPAQ